MSQEAAKFNFASRSWVDKSDPKNLNTYVKPINSKRAKNQNVIDNQKESISQALGNIRVRAEKLGQYVDGLLIAYQLEDLTHLSKIRVNLTNIQGYLSGAVNLIGKENWIPALERISLCKGIFERIEYESRENGPLDGTFLDDEERKVIVTGIETVFEGSRALNSDIIVQLTKTYLLRFNRVPDAPIDASPPIISKTLVQFKGRSYLIPDKNEKTFIKKAKFSFNNINRRSKELLKQAKSLAKTNKSFVNAVDNLTIIYNRSKDIKSKIKSKNIFTVKSLFEDIIAYADQIHVEDEGFLRSVNELKGLLNHTASKAPKVEKDFGVTLFENEKKKISGEKINPISVPPTKDNLLSILSAASVLYAKNITPTVTDPVGLDIRETLIQTINSINNIEVFEKSFYNFMKHVNNIRDKILVEKRYIYEILYKYVPDIINALKQKKELPEKQIVKNKSVVKKVENKPKKVENKTQNKQLVDKPKNSKEKFDIVKKLNRRIDDLATELKLVKNQNSELVIQVRDYVNKNNIPEAENRCKKVAEGISKEFQPRVVEVLNLLRRL